MGIGFPEGMIVTIVALLPFAVTVWAVWTLRDVQQSQRAIEGRLETIERLLRER